MYRLTHKCEASDRMVMARVLDDSIFMICCEGRLWRVYHGDTDQLYPGWFFYTMSWYGREHLIVAGEHQGDSFLALINASGHMVKHCPTRAYISVISPVEGEVYVGQENKPAVPATKGWSKLAISPDGRTVDLVPHYRHGTGLFGMFTPTGYMITYQPDDVLIPLGWFDGWGCCYLDREHKTVDVRCKEGERYRLCQMDEEARDAPVYSDGCAISPWGDVQLTINREGCLTVYLYRYRPWSKAEHHLFPQQKRPAIKQLYLLRGRAGLWRHMPRERTELVAGYIADGEAPL